MFILKKGHQPGVYVPLRALFLVLKCSVLYPLYSTVQCSKGQYSAVLCSAIRGSTVQYCAVQ